MRHSRSCCKNECHSTGINKWKLFGGAALGLVAAAVIVNLSDIRRYIKITRM